MEYLTIMLWFSLLWAFLQVVIYARFTSKLPPGPISVPVIGSLFKVGSKTHESLAELAKTYGPLMTIQLGCVTNIVASSAYMAKEVLQKHDQHISSRPIPDATRILNHHEVSIVCLPSTDLQWRNLRKCFSSQMFSTQRLNDNETVRLQKVRDLMDYIRESSRCRRVINIGQIISSTILNIISATMFSMDLAQPDSDFAHDFKTLVSGVMEELGSSNLVDYFPFLRPFDPQGIRRRMTIYFGKLDKLFDTIIDKRLKSRQKNATDDLLDVLLQLTQGNDFKLSHLHIKALIKEKINALTNESLKSELEKQMKEKAKPEERKSKKKAKPEEETVKWSDKQEKTTLQKEITESKTEKPKKRNKKNHNQGFEKTEDTNPMTKETTKLHIPVIPPQETNPITTKLQIPVIPPQETTGQPMLGLEQANPGLEKQDTNPKDTTGKPKQGLEKPVPQETTGQPMHGLEQANPISEDRKEIPNRD
ncbi:hypothetical protein IFM89_026855 [Coptis chinensis]|uniref:Cytochrome P450 n=1 Tax=Coptis chinensis TaxID=261450 RepID=A0A835LSJ6_9MAGN|nr:hypothetical protein IFM89_026855 [Coptis chinensis]